jgi:hypothetical protein
MVRITYCYNDRSVYIIHSLDDYEEGLELERWLRKNKIIVEDLYLIEIRNIIRLDVSDESQYEIAEKVVLDRDCEDLKL